VIEAIQQATHMTPLAVAMACAASAGLAALVSGYVTMKVMSDKQTAEIRKKVAKPPTRKRRVQFTAEETLRVAALLDEYYKAEHKCDHLAAANVWQEVNRIARRPDYDPNGNGHAELELHNRASFAVIITEPIPDPANDNALN
jgi:hypothetical protein